MDTEIIQGAANYGYEIHIQMTFYKPFTDELYELCLSLFHNIVSDFQNEGVCEDKESFNSNF